MKLQVIHTETRPVQASSLYCYWIRVPDESGALRAVWIDSEMRAFEGQMEGEKSEGALIDEPDGRVGVATGATLYRLNYV